MSEKILIPVLPLRDVVVYPHMVVPLFVGRERSIAALDVAMEGDKRILLSAQKKPLENDPTQDDIYTVGTVANILQLLKLPDGTVKVLVEGIDRGKILDYRFDSPYFCAEMELFNLDDVSEREAEVLCRSIIEKFETYIKLNKKISPEIIAPLSGISDLARLIDTIAAHLPLKISSKQIILAEADLKERLRHLIEILDYETESIQIDKQISSNIKRQMDKSQREYYLNEKRKAVERELGDLLGEDSESEIEVLNSKIKNSGMSKEAAEKSHAELKKLKSMSPMSAEATVCRNYIDWMLAVPWKKKTAIKSNLNKAEDILNAEHYGLEEAKERILEHLAVQKRVRKLKGPVLCLVGPPGVGKTSLGQSIAKAVGREFIRMSLGGVRDEAEIRGHRRTYIGAMPGKILQKLAKVKVRNPLFLLDEIDKMASDFRGDPAAALLEVLDPEQNNTFSDHYLEVDYDLSDIMFVATSNSLDIPEPLLDRMEVIRISGYTEDEKMNIAGNYLLPKQLKNHGLQEEELKISEQTIQDIIRHYTREAGVRSLERELSKLSRKVVKSLLLDKDKKSHQVTVKNIDTYLGVRKYRYGEIATEDRIGQVVGLAWTQVGGEILMIEAVGFEGSGKLIRTGKLGDVMKESIQAAISVIRCRAAKLGIQPSVFEKTDIHIHVPEGATPKDGPSAGIAMCVAIASMLTRIPVSRKVAMTGEVTLKGQVLPIGGLKEKLLASRRAGVDHVIIPQDNIRELKEIPDAIYQGLKIHPVQWIDEVLDISLVYKPEALVVSNDFHTVLDEKDSVSDKARKH